MEGGLTEECGAGIFACAETCRRTALRIEKAGAVARALLEGVAIELVRTSAAARATFLPPWLCHE